MLLGRLLVVLAAISSNNRPGEKPCKTKVIRSDMNKVAPGEKFDDTLN